MSRIHQLKGKKKRGETEAKAIYELKAEKEIETCLKGLKEAKLNAAINLRNSEKKIAR